MLAGTWEAQTASHNAGGSVRTIFMETIWLFFKNDKGISKPQFHCWDCTL